MNLIEIDFENAKGYPTGVFSWAIIIFQKLLHENERVSQQWGSVRAWMGNMDLLKDLFIYLVRLKKNLIDMYLEN